GGAMTRTSRWRWRPALGAVLFVLALGAGGLFKAATAEPIKPPLFPVPLSQPKGEQPAWTAPGDNSAPRAVEVATEPRPAPTHELAPPARPAESTDSEKSTPPTPPVFNLQPGEPRLNVEASAPMAPPIGPSGPPVAAQLPPPPSFDPPGSVAAPVVPL